MPFVHMSRRFFGVGADDGFSWSRSFDAVEVEDFTFDTEITENPVATGVSLVDHAFDLPIKLVITAWVSDLPMNGLDMDEFAAEGPSRSLAAYAWLRRLQKAHEPFSVQTGLDLFPAMMITSLKTKKDAKTANIIAFTVELKEVLFANTQYVFYPMKPKVKRAVEKKKDDGQKPEDEPDDAVKKKVRKTYLKLVKDFITGEG